MTKHDFWRYLRERLESMMVPFSIRKEDGPTVVRIRGIPAPLDIHKDGDGYLVRILEQKWRLGKVRNPSVLPWKAIAEALVDSVAKLEPLRCTVAHGRPDSLSGSTPPSGETAARSS